MQSGVNPWLHLDALKLRSARYARSEFSLRSRSAQSAHFCVRERSRARFAKMWKKHSFARRASKNAFLPQRQAFLSFLRSERSKNQLERRPEAKRNSERAQRAEIDLGFKKTSRKNPFFTGFPWLPAGAGVMNQGLTAWSSGAPAQRNTFPFSSLPKRRLASLTRLGEIPMNHLHSYEMDLQTVSPNTSNHRKAHIMFSLLVIQASKLSLQTVIFRLQGFYNPVLQDLIFGLKMVNSKKLYLKIIVDKIIGNCLTIVREFVKNSVIKVELEVEHAGLVQVSSQGKILV